MSTDSNYEVPSIGLEIQNELINTVVSCADIHNIKINTLFKNIYNNQHVLNTIVSSNEYPQSLYNYVEKDTEDSLDKSTKLTSTNYHNIIKYLIDNIDDISDILITFIEKDSSSNLSELDKHVFSFGYNEQTGSDNLTRFFDSMISNLFKRYLLQDPILMFKFQELLLISTIGFLDFEFKLFDKNKLEEIIKDALNFTSEKYFSPLCKQLEYKTLLDAFCSTFQTTCTRFNISQDEFIQYSETYKLVLSLLGLDQLSPEDLAKKNPFPS